MDKIRMYRVGMNGWQKTCSSMDEALASRPEFEFIDDRLARQFPFEEIEEEAPEIEPEIEVEPEPELESESKAEDAEVSYSELSEKEKKVRLELIAREHGVELDKRKKLEDLEKIIDELMGE